MKHSSPPAAGRPVGPRRVTAAVAAALCLSVALTACAPEPGAGTGSQDKPGNSSTKGGGGDSSGSSWSKPRHEPDITKQKTLPKGFPTDAFAVPKGATIDDAGERGPGVWFVVLSAKDRAAADALWAEVISTNGFAEQDAAETPEGGRSATLSNTRLTVQALTLPGKDGAALLSYDLSTPPPSE
ncbi:hypothetical protein [Leucobacter iarius]|uniref:Lipoprotein n=1 Tax=Leucobacter iarius TaxID=333963 RepID=A0ABN2LKD9_9MICO